MDKLNMQTPNIVDENIEKIQNLFPNVITESEKGKSIDFDLLKQELSNVLVEGNKEKYQLTWPGKKEAIITANTPTTKTLRPIREKSVDFDNTQNVYIEGENLEVLKILQESYLNKIKCIYIDPPYNTGNDFIYNDNFSKSKNEELEQSGQIDEEGNKMVSNPQSSGKYHSNWLSMMYPRLKLARNLLTEDGVIFISIDDNEVDNLKKICDEIFGENNFITSVIWKNKFGSGAKTTGFISVHEYILVYKKDKIDNITKSLSKEEKDNYNKQKDEKFSKRGGYVTQPLSVTTFGNRPNLRYAVKYKNQEIWPEKQWVWSKERMEEAIKNNDVVFNKQKDGTYKIRSKKYLIDDQGNERRGKPTTFFTDVYTQNGTNDMRSLFNEILFDYSKPVDLIMYFLNLQTSENINKDYIILDFFSGSATTAHACMKLNSEDGGNRKFIMVQVPEQCDEKSEAYKNGYKNICEIGQERIRRAASKIKEETNANIDYRFRVYKVDSSCMKDIYYTPNELTQKQIDMFETNIKEDRTSEDLLTSVILDLGLTLDLNIKIETFNNYKLYIVDDNALVVCFDDNINIDLIDEIIKINPLKVVFKDSSFKTDSDKVNIEEQFKKYSNEIEISII